MCGAEFSQVRNKFRFSCNFAAQLLGCSESTFGILRESTLWLPLAPNAITKRHATSHVTYSHSIYEVDWMNFALTYRAYGGIWTQNSKFRMLSSLCTRNHSMQPTRGMADVEDYLFAFLTSSLDTTYRIILRRHYLHKPTPIDLARSL